MPANSLTIRIDPHIAIREPLVPAHDAAAASVLIAMHSQLSARRMHMKLTCTPPCTNIFT
jgi:hypothetical protein